MDDLSQKISSILSDPQALEQIKGLSSMLGLGDTKQEPVQKQDDNSSLLANLTGGLSGESLSLLGKLAPLLSNINQEDDTTRLLVALRPFLSPKRQKKLDESGKIIKMMRLMPLLKEFSIFDSLL